MKFRKRINVFNVFYPSFYSQVITWFQNRRAKQKRDIEELKKDFESVKALAGQKNFLENIEDIKTMHDESLSPQKI